MWRRGDTNSLLPLRAAEGSAFSSCLTPSEGILPLAQEGRIILGKLEQTAASSPFRRTRRWLVSTSASAQPSESLGESAAETEQSSRKGTCSQEVAAADANAEAVTNYIVEMAEKFVQKGEKVTPTRKLEEMRTCDDRLWDCLDTVEFVLDVEEIFNVTIPDEVADSFQSVQEIAEYVHAQRQKRGDMKPNTS